MDQGSPPSPRTRESMLGSAFTAVKNYFTPERQHTKTYEGLGITPLARDFASLTLEESTANTSDSFKTSHSRTDDSFQSTYSFDNDLERSDVVVETDSSEKEDNLTVIVEETLIDDSITTACHDDNETNELDTSAKSHGEKRSQDTVVHDSPKKVKLNHETYAAMPQIEELELNCTYSKEDQPIPAPVITVTSLVEEIDYEQLLETFSSSLSDSPLKFEVEAFEPVENITEETVVKAGSNEIVDDSVTYEVQDILPDVPLVSPAVVPVAVEDQEGDLPVPVVEENLAKEAVVDSIDVEAINNEVNNDSVIFEAKDALADVPLVSLSVDDNEDDVRKATEDKNVVEKAVVTNVSDQTIQTENCQVKAALCDAPVELSEILQASPAEKCAFDVVSLGTNELEAVVEQNIATATVFNQTIDIDIENCQVEEDSVLCEAQDELPEISQTFLADKCAFEVVSLGSEGLEAVEEKNVSIATVFNQTIDIATENCQVEEDSVLCEAQEVLSEILPAPAVDKCLIGNELPKAGEKLEQEPAEECTSGDVLKTENHQVSEELRSDIPNVRPIDNASIPGEIVSIGFEDGEDEPLPVVNHENDDSLSTSQDYISAINSVLSRTMAELSVDPKLEFSPRGDETICLDETQRTDFKNDCSIASSPKVKEEIYSLQDTSSTNIEITSTNFLTPITEVMEDSFSSWTSGSPNQLIITSLPPKPLLESPSNLSLDSPQNEMLLKKGKLMVESTPQPLASKTAKNNMSDVSPIVVCLSEEQTSETDSPYTKCLLDQAMIQNTPDASVKSTEESGPTNVTETLAKIDCESNCAVLDATKIIASSGLNDTKTLRNSFLSETKILNETHVLSKTPAINSTITLEPNLDHTVTLATAIENANLNVTRTLMNDDTRENWNTSFVNKNKNTGAGVLKEINDNFMNNSMGGWFSNSIKSPEKMNQNLALNEVFSSVNHFQVINMANQPTLPIQRESFYINFDPLYQKNLLGDVNCNHGAGNKDGAALDLMGLEITSNEENLRIEIERLRKLYANQEQEAQGKFDELQKKSDALEKEYQEATATLVQIDDRNSSLQSQVQEVGTSNVKLAYISEEYQKVVKDLRVELEERRQTQHPDPATLVAERDSYRQHLQSAEAAFIDVLTKYEKLRNLLMDLKKNVAQRERETADLRRESIRLDEMIRVNETMAKTSLDDLRNTLRDENEQYNTDVTRITAQLRKTELSHKHLHDSYDKIVADNNKISALCDDFIAGKS